MLYKDYLWCTNCGFNLFVKNGLLKDGRQLYKCCVCNSTTRNYCMKQGEKIFKESDLLPILLKSNDSLDDQELYSLGVLLADGSISDSGILQLNILAKDKEIAEIVKKALVIPNDIKYYIRKDTNQEVLLLRYQYKYCTNYFMLKGICPNKTGKEVLLPFMKNPHFVRGLFDGNGCLFINRDKHKYELSFTSGCYQFLEDLNNFFKLNLNVGAAKVMTQKNKTGDSYRITMYKKALLLFCEWMYKDSNGLRLERKYQKYLEIKNNVKR